MSKNPQWPVGEGQLTTFVRAEGLPPRSDKDVMGFGERGMAIPRDGKADNRTLWLTIRKALLMIVRAIEGVYGKHD